MTIVDRYLMFLFIKIFLVCFVSFTGLFIIVHLFSNLDELTALSKPVGWASLMWEFYGPRVAEVFDKTAAVWALVAAVFAVNLMQRRRELTAVEAAGITKSRLLRSVFVCSVVIVGLAIANRELIIPQVKDQLVRTAQNWANKENIPLAVYQEVDSGLKIRGQELSLLENKISNVEVQLPLETEHHLSRFRAPSATVEPANAEHPAGLLLHSISTGLQSDNFDSYAVDEKTIVYWPGDTSWLMPDQCFVVCGFDPYEAAYGKKLQDYQSMQEMLVELRKPRLWFGNESQINVHARILQPVLDFTLLLLGLPVAISRMDKNIFISAGICFLIVGGMQLTIIACHSLGSYSIIQPTVLAPWLPVMMFSPLAVVASWRINR